MLLPRLFNFDDAFNDVWNDDFFRHAPRRAHLMKTDVRELEKSYELDVELPGYNKEDVKIELKDGYLSVSAETKKSNDEKDEKGNYIRRERYSGSCSRTFYVGKEINQEDIHAKFENGILKLTFPKESEKQIEEKKYIEIEG